jgi:trimeric autotransporter adhesin
MPKDQALFPWILSTHDLSDRGLSEYAAVRAIERTFFAWRIAAVRFRCAVLDQHCADGAAAKSRTRQCRSCFLQWRASTASRPAPLDPIRRAIAEEMQKITALRRSSSFGSRPPTRLESAATMAPPVETNGHTDDARAWTTPGARDSGLRLRRNASSESMARAPLQRAIELVAASDLGRSSVPTRSPTAPTTAPTAATEPGVVHRRFGPGPAASSLEVGGAPYTPTSPALLRVAEVAAATAVVPAPREPVVYEPRQGAEQRRAERDAAAFRQLLRQGAVSGLKSSIAASPFAVAPSPLAVAPSPLAAAEWREAEEAAAAHALAVEKAAIAARAAASKLAAAERAEELARVAALTTALSSPSAVTTAPSSAGCSTARATPLTSAVAPVFSRAFVPPPPSTPRAIEPLALLRPNPPPVSPLLLALASTALAQRGIGKAMPSAAKDVLRRSASFDSKGVSPTSAAPKAPPPKVTFGDPSSSELSERSTLGPLGRPAAVATTVGPSQQSPAAAAQPPRPPMAELQQSPAAAAQLQRPPPQRQLSPPRLIAKLQQSPQPARGTFMLPARSGSTTSCPQGPQGCSSPPASRSPESEPMALALASPVPPVRAPTTLTTAPMPPPRRSRSGLQTPPATPEQEFGVSFSYVQQHMTTVERQNGSRAVSVRFSDDEGLGACAEVEKAEAELPAAVEAEAELVFPEQAEAERDDAVRLAAETAEAERFAAEQADAERLAEEAVAAAEMRVAKARAAAERAAAATAAAARSLAEKAEAERVAIEKEAAARLASHEAKVERLAELGAAREKAKVEERERLVPNMARDPGWLQRENVTYAEKKSIGVATVNQLSEEVNRILFQLKALEEAEAERMALEEAEAERKALEKAEAERMALEEAEAAERKALEKAEAERKALEKAEAEWERAQAERLASEKAEAERAAAETAAMAAAALLAAKMAAAERAAAEKAKAESSAAKKAEAERVAAAVSQLPNMDQAPSQLSEALPKPTTARPTPTTAPPKPITALPEPTTAPTEPITAPTEPITAPTEPITAPTEPIAAPTEPITAPPEPAELPNSTERAACLEAAPPAAPSDESKKDPASHASAHHNAAPSASPSDESTKDPASLLPRLPPLPRRPPPPSPSRRTSMPPAAAETQSLPVPAAEALEPSAAAAEEPPAALEPATAPAALEPVTAPAALEPATAPAALEPVTAPAALEPATAPAALEPVTAPAALEPATAPAALEPVTAPAALEPVTAAAALEPSDDAVKRAAAVKVQAARRAQFDRARVAKLREQRAQARREELAAELRESEATRAAAVKVQAARRAQLDRARVGQLREQRAQARREAMASRAALDVEVLDPFASDVEASDVEAKDAASPGRQHTKALELLKARLGGGFDKGDVGASVPMRRRPSCSVSAVVSTLASGAEATDGGAHHGAPKVSKWATVKAIDDSAQRQRLAKPSKSPRPSAVVSAGSAAPSPLPDVSEAESSASYRSSGSCRSVGEETPDLVLATQPTELRAAAYDEDMENDAREWIEAVTGAPVGDKECSFKDLLMSGEVLCELVNVIVPGSCPPPVVPKNALVAPSVHRENIGNYLQACTAIGLLPSDSFQTVDLYEGRDMMAVLRQVHALGRLAQRLGYDGPTLGARESTAAPRTFSEAQLRESREQEKLLYKQARPVIAL